MLAAQNRNRPAPDEGAGGRDINCQWHQRRMITLKADHFRRSRRADRAQLYVSRNDIADFLELTILR